MGKKLKDSRTMDSFIKEYALTGSIEAASVKAGISKFTGYQWANQPEIGARVQAQVLTELYKLSPKALKLLVNAMDSESTPIKLKTEIARDILDRAGYSKNRRESQQDTARIEVMSKDQLLTYIKNLEAEVIDIEPEPDLQDDKTLKMLE